MVLLRRSLLAAAAIISLAGFWFWWNRPQPVDMAAYVPADSIVYIEANSLPEIAGAVASTDAWRALARDLEVADLGRTDWLSRLVRWTGIGPADAVLLSRAQVGLTLLGFDATEEESTTLKITPRVALVVETHTGESRVRTAIEKLVGNYARRALDAPEFKTQQADDISFLSWTEPEGRRRRIIAAVTESLAVVGNDESAVEACLSVRRGERPALSTDGRLAEMRERMHAESALAFGYVPRASAPKLLEVTILAYVKQISINPKTQSVVASLLPQLADRILSGAAWSTRVHNGAVEDYYFLALEGSLAPRVSQALVSSNGAATGASEFLPVDAYQVSSYNYRDPEAAWGNFIAALSSQLDALSSPFVSLFLAEALKPYGIENPREFLRAAGPEFVTARLDDGGESTVLIARVRDREALLRQVRRRLGGAARTAQVGEAQMMYSTDEDVRAASFVGDHLIMGSADNVRRCLDARATNRTLSANESFTKAPREAFASPPAGVVTFTDDREAAKDFVAHFLKGGAANRVGRSGDEALERALAERAYAVTESRFVEDGYERITRSSFGNFGALVTRFVPGSESR